MKLLAAVLAAIYSVYASEPCTQHLHDYLNNYQNLPGAARPICDDDGTYSPKQCRGSGCYCSDADGNDLGYFTNYGNGTDIMNCKCARDADTNSFERTGYIGNIYRCDHKGSYEKIQCLGSSCFCADANGEPLEDSEWVTKGILDQLNC